MNNKPLRTKLPGLFAIIYYALASVAFAVESEPTPHSEPVAPPSYQLVFSDDFSTDPNTNGNWTVFRRQDNPNREGYWDPTQQVWYLTTRFFNLACAAFANYELTATNWKVDFKYRVDNGPGGADGFVFMFYKDKSAYELRPPDSGTYMAFQTRNPDNSKNPVPGYGLQFDTYQYRGCDPLLENYVAIVQNVICHSAQVYRPFDKIDDNTWHSVEFTFNNGHLACTVDGSAVEGATISDPDYSHTGIGFGAGTGSYVSNQIIDDFEIWIAQ
jgi:hypothetical protein